VPATLNWDQWLGVRAPRPYLADYYHPGNWRKNAWSSAPVRWATWAVTFFDPVFEALALGSPNTVRSEGPAATAQNWALHEIIHYEFPATKYNRGSHG